MQTASHSHPQSVNDGYGLLRTYLCLARFYYLTGFHSFNPHNNALWRRLSHHNVHGFHSLGHRSLRCSNTLTWSPVTSTQTVCLSSPHPRCRSTLLCIAASFSLRGHFTVLPSLCGPRASTLAVPLSFSQESCWHSSRFYHRECSKREKSSRGIIRILRGYNLKKYITILILYLEDGK